ncbi:MAG: acetyl-CoA carboxylase biotin carboxylase subunit, partial [Desulfobacterales bacterium]|nr:acetyl-CoA carboxylase biotin carboxylase subunit [Desulfobacterales bacterium]
VVKRPEQIKKAFEKCRSRAKASFGDESVYLEKYLASPRHIEIQIVADQFGNVWHLGERDCSVQRRHQKVIEESPSPAVTEKIRAKMGDDAVRAASAIGYDSVGTVEMMMDENKDYYFLEMNTRIQVEHGITELRTGTDLVELQILSAAGELLVAGNKSASGHSIECRIYAEKPLTFLPSCGVIQELSFPSGNGIRIDHSIEKGFNVTPYYDPLIAKVMVWSENRKSCIRKMWSALDATILSGISTNIPFLMRVLEDDEFIDCGATTLLTEKILSKMKSATQLAKVV